MSNLHQKSNLMVGSLSTVNCQHHATESRLLHIDDQLINTIDCRQVSCSCIPDLSAA